jgi:hypothetical protein
MANLAMSPYIELDEDIYEYLKSQAEPFTDTPNTVLRRLLRLDDGPKGEIQQPAMSGAASRPDPAPRTKKRAGARKSGGRTRAPSGTLLPEQRYELPLLRALIDAGGEAPYREVLTSVGRALSDEFMPADHETLAWGASAGIRGSSSCGCAVSNAVRWTARRHAASGESPKPGGRQL